VLPLATLLLLGGCLYGSRIQLGDIWVEAGHDLALEGSHAIFAID
jgi:hypothetical protein